MLETHRYETDPDTLYRHARAALLDLGARDLRLAPEQRRIDAAFRVFLFTDDVAVRVEAAPAGSVLTVRSASRVGKHDLGVNRRRVNRFLRALREAGLQERTSAEAMAK